MSTRTPDQLADYNDAFVAHAGRCHFCQNDPTSFCHTGHVLMSASWGDEACFEEADRLMEGVPE